jgi:hypothetical protein
MAIVAHGRARSDDLRQIRAPCAALVVEVPGRLRICSAANPNPVVVIAAFTRQITGVVISLPVVDGLCAHDGPMGCVKGISGCWRASMLVLLWSSFANIDKRENNNGREQSPQYFHGRSFAQRRLKVLI